MKKFLLTLIVLVGSCYAYSQCLTNSITINTGYDPLTSSAVTPGVDGGTPVPDPKWIVSFETPGIATALISTGLIEVVPGAAADDLTRWSGWVANPPGTPGGYIGCLNSTTYTTDGTGPTGTAYSATFSRPFKTCIADSIKLDIYISNDNYILSTDIDGVSLAFSQPVSTATTNYTMFTHFTQTVYLSAGLHHFNVVQNNYNVTWVAPNPTAMDIYGTLSSATATNSLVSESYPACATYTCSGTCNAISLPDSLHPCIGDVVTLAATLIGTDSVLSIRWSPPVGISDTTILNPTLTAGTSGYRYITVRSLIPFNLVANGDFSAGNTGFTSSYSYVTGPGSLFPEGVYTITTDPFLEHPGAVSFGDHTTGLGMMMAVNGASTPISVWCETIPVTTFTDYDFSAWMANWSTADVGVGAPNLQFQINGSLIGSPFTITTAPGVWDNFFTVWNSGATTVATICIYDLNTVPGGNDFALDDISFQPVCVAEDSIYIDVTLPDTTAFRRDTTLCILAAPILLSGEPSYTSYLWNTGATTITILGSVSGTYWVKNITGCALRTDTFNVTYIPVPVVSLGNDTAFCIGDSITLSSVQPAGSTYLWSTGATTSSITVSTSGTYWLQVFNGYCTNTDTINVTVSPHPIVDLGPDTFSCAGVPIILQSSVSYISPVYLWSDGSAGATLSAGIPGTYWLQVTVAGCSGADTINVNIIYDTFKLFNGDTAICRGFSVPVFLNANPAATFQWLPTAGIPNPHVGQPVIVPDTSAMYYVTVSITGCPDIVDSFYIDVQPDPILFAGGNKNVCQFDTLQIRSSVTPNWYTHYTYSWTPATGLDDPTKSNVIFTAGSTTTYYVTVTTPAGCSYKDSATITVFPGNFASIDTGGSVCPHDSVQFWASGGLAYVWHPGMYLSDSTSATPWTFAITSQAYTMIATSADGCRDTLTTNIVVHPAAHIYLGDSVTIFPGESYHIQPQTNCTYFAWFPPAGLDNAYVSDPTATPELSTKYIVHAMTEWGCKTVDSISIYFDVASVLAIPNAFTPGSSVNNTLKVIKRGEATLTYFRIFNRWGNLVFETKDIDEGWNGNFHGKPQPYDVYVYQVEAVTNTGSIFHKKGNVTLIR